MLRRVILLVAAAMAGAIAVGAWWWLRAPRVSDPRALRLVQAAAEGREAVTLSGEARVTGAGPYAPKRLQVIQKGDKMRLGDGGAVVVDDGNDVYRIDPEMHTAQRYRAADVHGDLKRLAENYVVTLDGEEKVAGRKTTVVAMRHRGGRVARRLWVDDETDAVLRQETYDGSGGVRSGMVFERVEYGTKVPEDAFEVPEGWAVVDAVSDLDEGSLTLDALSKQVGFEVRVPRHVPQGFSRTGAFAVRMGRYGYPAAELCYSDGLRRFCVYQHARHEEGSSGEEQGTGRGQGHRHPYRGGCGQAEAMGFRGSRTVRVELADRMVVVVGDLAQQELARVARSVAD